MTQRTFPWQRRNLRLFDHPYNATMTNERAVELPIAREWTATLPKVGLGLEVGNVLNHYGIETPNRRIVDKYEDVAYASNIDVFDIKGRYDWIVSVSTIEHIRQGDDGDNPQASLAALWFLTGVLEGGRMLVTIGLGQNPALDRHLLSTYYPAGCRTVWLYVRERSADPRDNVWELIDREKLQRDPRPYGPTHGANALWVGEW